MSPEGDLFDLIAGRYSKKGPNLGVFLKGHAGDDVRVDRVNKDRPAEYVRKPALSIGLAVQPAVLQGLMSQPGFRGKGLLGRFLYAMPRSLLGRRKINTDAIPEQITVEYRSLLDVALRFHPPSGSDNEPTTVRIGLSTEAHSLLDPFKSRIESALGENGELGALKDWGGKLVGAICRIAGIYHGLKHVGGGQLEQTQIEAETMQAALKVGEYLICHAKAAYFEMGSDTSIDISRKMLAWIQTQQSGIFSKRDIYNALRGTVQCVTDVEDPLSLLKKHGYIRSIEQEHKGRGRKPSPRFEVNPLYLKQSSETKSQTSAANCAYSA